MSEPSNISLSNKFPTWSGLIDRAALAVAVYVAAKGWINSADVPVIGQFLGELLSVGLLGFFAWYQNRPVNLAEAARSISPETTVITTPEIAKATQDTSIVSSDDKKVVKK